MKSDNFHSTNISLLLFFNHFTFQFNPNSPLSDHFDHYNGLVGDAPILEDAPEEEIAAYRQDLLEARDILKNAYDFDEANVGDENGEGGW